MTDSTDDFHFAEDYSLAPFEDNCKLLGTLLDDCLKIEVGEELFSKVERIRALAECAAALSKAHDTGASSLLSQRLVDELRNMSIQEALPLARAFGHYLNLTSIAELHHKVRRARLENKTAKSCDAVFERLIAEGVSPEQLFEAVKNQTVEIVLTAHPTQVNRRTLQYKHTKIAALLQQHDRGDLTPDEKHQVLQELVREITALWQTDELRRQKPTPLDEARGGLHIVEQSLWAAVPQLLRRVSDALKKHTGKELPMDATPIRFGSWMGGDRDGNPNVTAKTTEHVVYLARWMAADLYLREIDALRFELSMFQCNEQVWRMASDIIDMHQDDPRPSPVSYDAHRTSDAPQKPHQKDILIGTNPGVVEAMEGLHSEMPSVPGMLPGQDIDGNSDVEFPFSPLATEHSLSSAPSDTLPDTPSTSSGHSNNLAYDSNNNIQNILGELPTPRPTRPAHLVIPGRDKGLPAMTARVVSGSAAFELSRMHGSSEDLPSLSARSNGARSPRRPVSTVDSEALSPRHRSKGFRVIRKTSEWLQQQKEQAHVGFHPYRIILGQVREKLINTRKRMEELLNRQEPSSNNPEDWYDSEEQMAEPLLTCYWSLWDCGSGIIAEGRLADLIRRLYTFGMSLMKLDLRQESTRHTEAMTAITEYLGMGSYKDWSEEERINWLTKELQGRRPLVPADMPMTRDVREVMDTFRVAAKLGKGSLSAYVISMTRAASDVLLVELLQREARLHVAGEEGSSPDHTNSLRVVPLFETLGDLEASADVMESLFSNDWYSSNLSIVHDNQQEVMLGYSDSGKDAGRLAANWALYRCQERLVSVSKKHGVKLTLFHGRGGTVGRGGGPMYLAIQSQPPGSVEGHFRITEQGEMVQAKFGIPVVAQSQLEVYTTAVLQAHLKPPPGAKGEEYQSTMEQLAARSCTEYRNIVFHHPHFIPYFKHATPESELGNMNIGSRPSRRKKDSTIHTLRAIPWIFAWTQTRMVLPTWLGIGDALTEAIAAGRLPFLKEMYEEWPFFQSTIDLIEMVLAKADMRIAAQYDDILVTDPEEKRLGAQLRKKYLDTVKAVLDITGHSRLLENNPTLRRLVEMRNPFIDPINILQTEILRRIRAEEGGPTSRMLKDALLITINGIAAGMRNTG